MSFRPITPNHRPVKPAVPALCAAVLACALAWPAQAFTLSTGLQRLPDGASRSTPSTAAPDGAGALGTRATWPVLLQRVGQSADARAATADANATAAQSRQQWAAAWMPRLDAQATSSRQQQRYNGLDSQTPSSVASLTATLPLWRPAERASADALAHTAEQARWQARSRQLAAAQELSQAWLDAAEAAEQWRLTQDHSRLLDEQLVINERRLQSGLGTVLDPLETRTRQSQMQAQSNQLAARLRSQALALERLSGGPVSAPKGLAPREAGSATVPSPSPSPAWASLNSLSSFNPELPTLADALTIAQDRYPALQEARLGVQAARETTRARHAEAWQPTLDASASASRTRQTQRFEGISEQQDIRTRAVGVQLNWPLFTGGVQSERHNEAAALLTAAEARVDSAQARLDTGLRDAYQRLEQARLRQARLGTLVDTAQATQEAIQRAWSAGLRSHTDLLNAQQQLFDARLSLASARVAALQAATDVLSWLDWLDADHIAPWMSQFELAIAP